MAASRIKLLAKRCAVMLSGEMIQSAFHFALNIMLVRVLPPADYGVFAIVLLMGGLSLTYMRSFAGLPANLHIPQHAGTRRSIPFEVTFGSVALIFTVVTCLIIMATLQFWLHADALTGGTFVALWAMRSYLRSVLFAKNLQVLASISDLVFTLSGGSLMVFLFFITANGVSLQRVFALLAAANALGILAALVLQRQKIHLTYRASARRRYQSIFRQVVWSTVGTTTANIQAQGQVLLIAALAGPAAYAPIAAMLTMFAPLRLISSALANMLQPEIAKLSSLGDDARIMMLSRRWTAALAFIGICYSITMVFAVPVLGSAVFDGQPRDLIGILVCGMSLTPLLYLMPKILLEVRRAFQTIAAISLAGAVIGMALVAILLLTQSPAWSLLGSVTSELVVFCCCWVCVLRPTSFGVFRSPSPTLAAADDLERRKGALSNAE